MTAVDKRLLWLPACAFALALGTASAQAQTDQSDAATAGQQDAAPAATADTTEGGATGSAVGPMQEGVIGKESAEHTFTSEDPGYGLGQFDDEMLRQRLASQGFMNLRDVVRSGSSVSGVADKDGQEVHVYVIPMDGQNYGAGQQGGDGGSPTTQE